MYKIQLLLVCTAAAAWTGCLAQSYASSPSNPSTPWNPSGADQKKQVVDLLIAIGNGDAGPFAVINDYKFIQHGIMDVDGKVGAFQLQALASSRNDTTINTIRVFQDNDVVFAHTGYNFFGPKIGFDVFRFEEGLIVEHWDNLQDTPDAGVTKNGAGHTMLDGPTVATDIDKTAANKALVTKFVVDVFVKGNTQNAGQYFNGDQLINHDPLAPADGLAAALAVDAALPAGTKLCSRTRHIYAEGNFVLVMCDGTLGQNASGFYDLYRVENNKIAEHWNNIQAIPPLCGWLNLNGKY